MAKRTIDVKAGRLFPFPFLVIGGVSLFAGLFIILSVPIGGLVLLFIGGLIFTAYEGTEIDPTARTIREYYSFLFLKTGRATRYESIEGMTIHKAQISQKMFTAHTTKSSTFRYTEYRAYIKMAGEEKVLLMRNKNKARLMEEARKIAQALNTTIADYAVAG